MSLIGLIPQLRTTNLNESVCFYTQTLGFALEFQYEDFYAGIRVGTQLFHLKLVDENDPSISSVEEGEHFHLYFEATDAGASAAALRENGVVFIKDLHETPWGTLEFVIQDNQGHTLYFGQS